VHAWELDLGVEDFDRSVICSCESLTLTLLESHSVAHAAVVKEKLQSRLT
jgi:hypothetical protein